MSNFDDNLPSEAQRNFAEIIADRLEIEIDENILLNKDGSQVEPDLLPVSEIYLGPTNNQDIVLESIKSFIGDLGYAESIVKSSQIPYRGWLITDE